MITKACTNNRCPAYAHFVYTVAVRCVLCRWDLKPAQRSIDAVGDFNGTRNGRVALPKKSATHAVG